MASAQRTEETVIATHDAAKKYLETAGAGLVGKNVTVHGHSPNLTVQIVAAPGESIVTVMSLISVATVPALKVSSLNFLEPANPHYFSAAVRALCGVAFEKRCTVIQFSNMTLPYVKGLLPYGAVPLTVPNQLDVEIKKNMELPGVSRHLTIDEYARLSGIYKRSLKYPHMAWLDLFMTNLKGINEDPQKVPVEKSEDLRRRLGVETTMVLIIPLNNAASLIERKTGAKVPTFDPVAAPLASSPVTTPSAAAPVAPTAPYYQAAHLPCYRPPSFLPGMDN